MTETCLNCGFNLPDSPREKRLTQTPNRRLVWVLGWQHIEGSKARARVCCGVGLFLQFATHYEELFENKVGDIPVALVEMPNGTVEIVDICNLQFIHDGDPEWLPPKLK